MKAIITILILLLTQNILSQEIELKVIGSDTYIKKIRSNGDYFYEPTKDYIVQVDNRKLFVFNFVNKCYKVKITKRKTKELRFYSNRTILKIKGISLINSTFKLILSEHKN